MEKDHETLARLRQDIFENNLHVKAIIQVRKSDEHIVCRFVERHHLFISRQDITGFRGTNEELNQLNEAGREKLAMLRKCIERLDDHVSDLNDSTLLTEVGSHRQQFHR